ncbi:hypothetical protein MKW98_003867 [Papaver atlanticum]|uniref:K-box domain-containing protein n=1 Tax=Papaver atlanticum TaxID=357466 RepID=A0AAD4XHL5_9MAGN|nr:hypothetical protein MKW98_003867 [Papaver atlanticum]
MPKKKVDEDCSCSNQPHPPLGQEHQFETPQPSKSTGMTYLMNPDRVKNKRGNNLTPINHTPTPRGDKHLGVDNRGIHKNEKRNNKFEIKLREPPVAESRVDLEGVENMDQEEDHARENKLVKRQRAKHWPLSEECASVRNLVWENEVANLAKMIENLEASKRNLMGEDLESCSIDELETAENQLEKSLLNIRGKKNELYGEKIEQLKQKEKQLLEVNAGLSEKCWASTTGTTEPTEKEIIPHETSSSSHEVESELQIVGPEGK